MLFTESVRKAVSLGLCRRKPFALYIMPDSDLVNFIASSEVCTYNDRVGDGFYINTFNNSFGLPVFIPAEMNAEEATVLFSQSDSGPVPDIEPCRMSTDRQWYIEHTGHVISDLSREGGKAVLSRIICGPSADIDWIETVERYFGAYKSTFRYIYYTPQTGAWVGASPEILLSRKEGSDSIATMALAGTRSVEIGEWDAKNSEEHNYVVNYIVDVLRHLGISPEVCDAENVRFGSIEHLCHRINADYSGNMIDVANALSPTPALAGLPLVRAMEHISYAEPHKRHCYGGYVGCRNFEGEFIYVNLRCVHFSVERFCIYAGGGITGKSSPEMEWLETEAKSEFLRRELIR